ncbi:phytoene desaturase family protein [Arthrobacter sulfonylureivorans]|uniref:NAD(P)/FAD-dependent oxidoreductase n=1 Tax=Arthrobacter sulfonylureivorans TaxID=2486855 RepID=A0ABY3W6X4_9MICC|nr:NAD(P)/FAD-dependent oxidoreductase [Arthrobacter sulfonylureivorans]UNK46015.1 NAD(P)/FAD-dependent oxidoreductase [Arthrobacter sulfonylureivorans]
MTDVAVVGAGPNGLAAAVIMARAGLDVTVFETAATPGGGARTLELIEPGHWHDICSAVHPMAAASLFFRSFGLDRRIQLLAPEVSYGHVIDGAAAAVAYRDLEQTVAGLGADGAAYRQLMGPLVERTNALMEFTMDQLLRVPAHPLTAFRYGIRTLEQGSPAWNLRFKEQFAPALLTGVAAHTPGGVRRPSSAGAGLMLGALAHAVGFPFPAGGSQAIIDAMVQDLRAHGGRLETEHRVASLAELTDARVVMLDTSPTEFLRLAGGRLPARYARALRHFRYGPGAAKVDFILSGPVPWAHPELRRAGTVHLGGTRQRMAASERAIARGRHSEDPVILAAQPAVVDPSRAPAGRHVLWAYCHVPNGSTRDMEPVITAALERAAPGFTDLVVDSASMSAADYAAYNPNYVGGDFGTGAVSLPQLAARPVLSPKPWRTPLDGVYLCSAGTPPGPGVHGMAGYRAAALALQTHFGLAVPPLQP